MRTPKGHFERLIFKGFLWSGIVVLTGLAVLLSGSTWHMYQKEQRAERDLNESLHTKADLEQRERKLSASVAAFKTDRGIEAELRERFPVAKAGEEVFVLIDSGSGGPEVGTPSRGSLWSKMRSWFGL